MRIALVVCDPLPEPDPDMAPLVRALEAAGAEPHVVAWDDVTVPWASFSLVVLRATWDYHLRPTEFLAWADRVSGSSILVNSLELVRWNVDKHYLARLQDASVAIVPTLFLRRGRASSLVSACAERGWSEVVIKPTISAASYRTIRAELADPAAGEGHLAKLLADGDAMVQPYLSSVEGYGERAIVCVEGQVTHAVRKSPRLWGGDEQVSSAVPVASDEHALVESVISQLPGGRAPLYARIDVARDHDGAPCVMEVELIEPSLFFDQSERCLAGFVEGLMSRARRRS